MQGRAQALAEIDLLLKKYGVYDLIKFWPLSPKKKKKGHIKTTKKTQNQTQPRYIKPQNEQSLKRNNYLPSSATKCLKP